MVNLTAFEIKVKLRSIVVPPWKNNVFTGSSSSDVWIWNDIWKTCSTQRRLDGRSRL